MITITNISNPAERRRAEQKHARANQKPLQFKITADDMADLMAIKSNKAHLDHERGRMFFFMGLSIALGLLYIIFNWNFAKDQGIITLEGGDATAFEEIQDIPQTLQTPPPPPQQLQLPKIIEVSDEVIIEEVDITIDVETSENMVVEDVEYELAPIEEEKAEEIFYASETPPRPVGGLKAFYGFITVNLKYPQRARTNQIKGRVFAQFVVDKDGTLTNFKILKGIGYGCDEEALRVLAIAPKWNPGKQRGQPVKVYMTLPIVFDLR
ncbi:MAG: energy transducer TonB [Reichenbachiella sp.]|uniref:energy transducer TonB n=1 Tax=Reichenbachiella sp. TaxID=2184521 RepID=UPI0032679228